MRELCREYDVNYVDLYGNARLVLPGLYINREVAETPAAEKRDLKSLFKPKSARVLRFLLKPGNSPDVSARSQKRRRLVSGRCTS